MKKLLLSILLVVCCINLPATSNDYSADTISVSRSNVSFSKPRPWTAAALTMGINGTVWAYDRFIDKSSFSKINIKTVKNNLKTGFVWDSDRIATNHLGHPFNGGLYFLAARRCGLNFWQSLPFSTAGSLVWELFAEKEPPGLNDIIATPLAGAAFGEVMHRSLNYIFDKNTRTRFPISLSLTLGDRFMSDGDKFSHGGHYPIIGLDMEYGDAFDISENRPFDYFFGSSTIHLGSSYTQPTFGDVCISGRLWAKELSTGNNSEANFGIWQQYEFYHNRRAKKGEDNSLFNLSETVAAGSGLQYRHEGATLAFRQSLFADIIALGAVENDNIFIIERHYNMGSGFALKSASALNWKGRLSISLQAKLFYLNTWGDYSTRADVEHGTLDPLYTDTMGDKGHSWAFVLNPEIDYFFTKNWGLTISAKRLGRDSRYRAYPPSKARTTEIFIGVKYAI